MNNYREDVLVFVPACMLCPTLQASSTKTLFWGADILAFLQQNGIPFLQLPCPESFFSHKDCGLHRKPHGVAFYEKVDGFSEYCTSLAQSVSLQVSAFQKKGTQKIIILGVEDSPTCAVTKITSRRTGRINRSGIFFQALQEIIGIKNAEVTFIGIERKKTEKTISSLAEKIEI